MFAAVYLAALAEQRAQHRFPPPAAAFSAAGDRRRRRLAAARRRTALASRPASRWSPRSWPGSPSDTCLAAPRLLGYFNESIGGWREGHRYLADSNIDWGQDLLRLEDRLRGEPAATPLWLAQAGDPPLPRGLAALGPAGSSAKEPRAASGAGRRRPLRDQRDSSCWGSTGRSPAPNRGGIRARSPATKQLAAAGGRGRAAPAAAPAGEIDAFEALRRLRLLRGSPSGRPTSGSAPRFSSSA